jgi:hypothetical protein
VDRLAPPSGVERSSVACCFAAPGWRSGCQVAHGGHLVAWSEGPVVLNVRRVVACGCRARAGCRVGAGGRRPIAPHSRSQRHDQVSRHSQVAADSRPGDVTFFAESYFFVLTSFV